MVFTLLFASHFSAGKISRPEVSGRLTLVHCFSLNYFFAVVALDEKIRQMD